ncbi:MAG: hypothetical protein ABSC01_12620 [Verrucomicrobiota bacterium]|jgi:hypothetical protein
MTKSDFEDYPKPIYDDGDTKLEIRKFSGSIAEYSRLTLLIANRLFLEGEIGAVKVKIHGDECVCLKPPRKMNLKIKNALHDERFEAEGEDDISHDGEFLIIQLGDKLAFDIGRLFDENDVIYDKEQYIQFIKDRGTEEGELKKAVYAANATRPMHPNIAILQDRLGKLESIIEAVEVNEDDRDSYEKAVEILRDDDGYFFEEIYQIKEGIRPRGATEAEDDAMSEIERRIEQLKRKMRQKLDEIGYESPED